MHSIYSYGPLRTFHGVCACFLALSFSPVVAQSPRIQVTPPGLDFGKVFLGNSAAITLTITNIGGAPLTITGVAVGSSGSHDFTTASIALPATIAPGGLLFTQVAYTPDRQSPDQGTLIIESNDPDQPVLTVSLLGSGEFAPIPRIFVSPRSVEFSGTPVGTLRSSTVILRNDGFGFLNVKRVGITGGRPGIFALGAVIPTPALLARNESLQVQVLYRPVDELLDFAHLVIDSDDAAEPVVRVAISGRGLLLTGPQISITPSALDFGQVPVGLPRSLSLTIANSGLQQLQISSIAIDADSSPDFTIVSGRLSTSLTIGKSLTIEVSYAPLDEGVDSGTLRIESNDAEDLLVSVPLSGSGIVPLFRRGDANSDGEVDLSDAISVLGQLFGSVPAPLCLDATDANDDATIDVSDAVFTLVWLFTSENELPAPGGAFCGVDPTEDDFAVCDYPREICD